MPAAYVVFRRDDEVLLQLRQHTGYMDGYWAMAAAGHVEAGESVLTAACREVAEELGVSVAAADLRPLCAMHRTGGNDLPIDQRVDFFFECRNWAGTPQRLEPDKAADLRWFRLDTLPEPVVPHERYVLEQVTTGSLMPVVTRGFER